MKHYAQVAQADEISFAQRALVGNIRATNPKYLGALLSSMSEVKKILVAGSIADSVAKKVTEYFEKKILMTKCTLPPTVLFLKTLFLLKITPKLWRIRT